MGELVSRREHLVGAMSDPEPLRPDAVLTRNPRVAYRELTDGSAVLLHLDSGAYHGLNDVGALVWGALQDRSTIDGVIDSIRGRFESAPPTLTSDVRAFVEGLVARGLVLVDRSKV